MPTPDKKIALYVINDRLVIGGVATIIRLLQVESTTHHATCILWLDEKPNKEEQGIRSLAWGLKGWRKWLTLICSFIPMRLIMSVIADRKSGKNVIIHLNTPYASTAIAAVSASIVTRAPLIYTVHANKSHISFFYWILENIIFQFSDRVVLELKASLNDYRKRNQEKLLFVPFGVKRTTIVRKWKVRKDAPFTFVAVNRLDRNRMVNIFIEAFARQMAENDSELHIVGDGEQRAALLDMAIRLGCGRRVKFFPAVAETAIQDILVDCDCFLTLSAGGDVGMAGKLAAGVGIPCLAYEFDQADTQDYSASSSGQLAGKMSFLAGASSAELYDHAAKTHAALYSSSEAMIDAYMQIYAGVIE